MDFVNITNDDAPSMDIPYYMEKLLSATDYDGLSIFLGTVTTKPDLEATKSKTVRLVQYDVHIARAEIKMKEICSTIRNRWMGVSNIVLVHRIGYVAPGGTYMFVGIIGHKAEETRSALAYASSQMSSLPFWKEETYEDDTRCWTSTHECFWRLNAEEREEVDKSYQCKHSSKSKGHPGPYAGMESFPEGGSMDMDMYDPTVNHRLKPSLRSCPFKAHKLP